VPGEEEKVVPYEFAAKLLELITLTTGVLLSIDANVKLIPGSDFEISPCPGTISFAYILLVEKNNDSKSAPIFKLKVDVLRRPLLRRRLEVFTAKGLV